MSGPPGPVGGERLARSTAWSVAGQILAAALGFLLVVFLGRTLGRELFGRYGVIISILAWVEFLVVTGVPDTLARFVAGDEGRRRALLRVSLRLELGLSLGVFLLFFFFSPLLASFLLHDRGLAFYFRLAALDIPLYGFFCLYHGYLRGVRAFARYSLSIVFYVALKCSASVCLVLAGLSLSGALLGNVLGSAGALLLARRMVAADLPPAGGERYPGRPILAFAAPLVLAILLFQGLLNADLWMVGRLLPGEPGEVGLYTAAWTLARTPYFLLMGLSVAIYPSLSRSLAAGQRQLTARYVEQAVRLYLLVICLAVPLAAAAGPRLMALIFGPQFLPEDSGPLLGVLVAGYCLVSANLVFGAVLMADGRTGLASAINAALLALQLLLTRLLIPRLGLAGAALATVLLGGACFLFGQGCLSTLYGARLRLATPARAFLAAAAPALLFFAWPARGPWLAVEGAAAGLLYLTGLFLSRELNREEIKGYAAQFRGAR